MNPKISIIAALGKNTRVIGNNNSLPWYISDDLKRFKKLTTGHPIIMGRKTFESIGKALPDRTNIVITNNTKYAREDILTVHSLDEALEEARAIESEEIFVIGGAQIYEQALPLADRLYLTIIDEEKDGDVFFPEYEHLFTTKVFEEKHESDNISYTWINLKR